MVPPPFTFSTLARRDNYEAANSHDVMVSKSGQPTIISPLDVASNFDHIQWHIKAHTGVLIQVFTMIIK